MIKPAGKALDPGLSGRWAGSFSPASLRQYWRLLVRRKWVIGGTLAAAVLIGLAATFLATRQYTATVLLEISRQRDTVIDVKDTVPRSNGIDLEFYQTQYSLLKARSLAERVANRLNLADDPHFFEVFRVAPKTLEPAPGAPADPLARRAQRQKIAVRLLLGQIAIAPIRASALANVSFTSPDRILSARIANAWAGEFIEATLQRRFNAAGYARDFLERRLVEVRQRLEDSERKVVQYAAEQRIVDVTPDQRGNASSVSERSLAGSDLERVSTQLTQATTDRETAESRVKVEGLAAASVADDQTLVALRQKRAEAATQYADMLAKFTPAYPPAVALSAQIAAIDASIRKEQARIGDTLAGQYRGARAREAALESRVRGLKHDVLDLRRRAIQYNIYQRDVDTNRELYNGLLQRYKEIGIAGGVGTNNVSIADPAIPPDGPSSPRLIVNLFIALLLGAVAAAAAVFALEQVDETVKDPADVAQVTNLPLLGVVPDSERIDPILALADPKSTITEAYLSVQTSLGFSTDHGVPRSIAVTSTRAEEGKSATAFALAHSLVRTRRRPILIDADLRAPSIHGSAGLVNTAGVSNFLAGDDDLAALIHAETDAGFAVMTAGPNPPNAAELLTSDRLATLIARLLEDYDHVVVDSPPILGLADAPLIASAVEGVVYIIEANGARAGMIRSALHRLRNANAHVIGAVLTRFNPKRTTYDYGYGYGYDYGSPDRGRRA